MCDDCHNDGQHEKERINAIRHIRRSNVTAFKGTKLEVVDQTIKTPRGTLKVVRGCRCKRSKCKKKYCECYGAGLPVSDPSRADALHACVCPDAVVVG